MTRIVDFEHISDFFFRGIPHLTGLDEKAIIMTGALVIEWLILYFFYKRKIFLKV